MLLSVDGVQLNLSISQWEEGTRAFWEGTIAGTDLGCPGEPVGRETSVSWRVGRAVTTPPPWPSLRCHQEPGFFSLSLNLRGTTSHPGHRFFLLPREGTVKDVPFITLEFCLAQLPVYVGSPTKCDLSHINRGQ